MDHLPHGHGYPHIGNIPMRAGFGLTATGKTNKQKEIVEYCLMLSLRRAFLFITCSKMKGYFLFRAFVILLGILASHSCTFSFLLSFCLNDNFNLIFLIHL